MGRAAGKVRFAEDRTHTGGITGRSDNAENCPLSGRPALGGTSAFAAVGQSSDAAQHWTDYDWPMTARSPRLEEAIRLHFAPLLRANGFTGTGRTFRRVEDDAAHVVNDEGFWYGGRRSEEDHGGKV